MKSTRAIIAIVIAGAIAGCSVYGGAPVYGDFHRVSSADLHAALVAVRKERQVPDAYAFRVVSANEIWIYFTLTRTATPTLQRAIMAAGNLRVSMSAQRSSRSCSIRTQTPNACGGAGFETELLDF